MMIIAWEVTSACNLSCDYCRASASSDPAPDELDTEEAMALIDEVAPLKPMLIMSGGEPLLRPDLFELIDHAVSSGLRVALATNGTLLNPGVVDELLRLGGVSRVSVSLDGLQLTHDARRGPGSFSSAMAGIENLRGRVPFQINMTVTRQNVGEIGAVLDLAEALGAKALHFFFVVPIGRAMEEEQVSPQDQESLLKEIATEAGRRQIEVQVTCAPQYTRVLREMGLRPSRCSGGCLAGTGFVFISRRGDVYPCGYLQVRAGSVREKSFAEIWEESPVFVSLRARVLKGRCGECGYRMVCGGCRARAYVAKGDYLEADPLCRYEV